MTYRMDVGLDAMIEHEKRHVRQAKRVVGNWTDFLTKIENRTKQRRLVHKK